MSELEHVHITPETVATYEMTPPHAPRVETEAYRKAHHFLIEEMDNPCDVCGVSKSTLADPERNPFGATAMETHHYPIERSLMNACDIKKVHKHYPQVIDQETFESFIDSPANLIVLCNVHHRSVTQGIHHLLTQDFVVLRYLKDGYQIVATEKEKDAILQKDEEIEKSGGL
jgi:hypothetical protein